ncbi:MAG TPA: acyltransferase [Rhodospirillaceae bacterium]|nr:acyltransferase [Rhodospirillaceae bacterium]
MGFSSVGRNVMIHETANIVGAHRISLGDNVRIDEFVTIKASSLIAIGSYIHIAGSSYLAATESLKLSDFVGLSHGVKIFCGSDDYSGQTLTNPTVPSAYRSVKQAPVLIGRHVIIGAGSVILPGVEIAEGCAIGALSLVVQSLEPWGIYGGVPVRRLKDRKRDLLVLEGRLRAELA